MNLNEQLINELCEKCHTTIYNLIPVYSPYMMTKDVMDIVIGFLFIIVGILILKYISHGYKSEKYDEYAVTPIIIGTCAGVLVLAGVITIMLSVYDYILWYNYPALRFLDTVLQIGG